MELLLELLKKTMEPQVDHYISNRPITIREVDNRITDLNQASPLQMNFNI
jgi:hypothetical protein